MPSEELPTHIRSAASQPTALLNGQRYPHLRCFLLPHACPCNSFFNRRFITDPPHNPAGKGTKSVTRLGHQRLTLHHPRSEKRSVEGLSHSRGASFRGSYCKITTATVPNALIPACRHSSRPGPDFSRVTLISTRCACHAFPRRLDTGKQERLPYLGSAV